MSEAMDRMVASVSGVVALLNALPASLDREQEHLDRICRLGYRVFVGLLDGGMPMAEAIGLMTPVVAAAERVAAICGLTMPAAASNFRTLIEMHRLIKGADLYGAIREWGKALEALGRNGEAGRA